MLQQEVCGRLCQYQVDATTQYLPHLGTMNNERDIRQQRRATPNIQGQSLQSVHPYLPTHHRFLATLSLNFRVALPPLLHAHDEGGGLRLEFPILQLSLSLIHI